MLLILILNFKNRKRGKNNFYFYKILIYKLNKLHILLRNLVVLFFLFKTVLIYIFIYKILIINTKKNINVVYHRAGHITEPDIFPHFTTY
jgi:hypothetical protein